MSILSSRYLSLLQNTLKVYFYMKVNQWLFVLIDLFVILKCQGKSKCHMYARNLTNLSYWPFGFDDDQARCTKVLAMRKVQRRVRPQ